MAVRKIGNLRWYIDVLLLLASIINYVDRQALSVAIPVIRDQYGLSNTDYSHIVFAFLLAYTIMQTASGVVIDWLGTRKGMAVFMGWWSVASVLHASARGLLSFGLFRFLLGMGEAGGWPASVRAIAEWFPPSERAFAVGVFSSGAGWGAVIAPPVVASIILHFGWQQAFLLTGVLGGVWLVPWLLLSHVPEKNPRLRDAEFQIIQHGREDSQHDVPGWFALFRYRQVWAFVLSRALIDPVWWFYVFWLPEYLKRQRHFSLEMIGTFAWIPFLAASVGNFLGGAVSNSLIKKGWNLGVARKTIVCVGGGLMMAGIAAGRTPHAMYCVALISLATLGYSALATNVITLMTDVFPKTVVASVYGITGTAAGTAGMIFTLIVGRVVDEGSYLPIFILAGVLPVLAVLIVVTMLGPVKMIPRLCRVEA